MKKFISFPKIRDFKSALKELTESARYIGLDEDGQPIYNHDPLPTLTFTINKYINYRIGDIYNCSYLWLHT